MMDSKQTRRWSARAYIFDMDGTLLDNSAYHVRAWQRFAKSYGKSLAKRDVLAWMGARASYFIERIFGTGLSTEEVDRLCAEKEKIYRRICKPKLADGLREWLDYAHARRIPCALATGGPRENVDFTLDALNMRNDFVAIVDGSMYTRSKPDPECFLKAAALMGVKPSDCRVYEDAVNGVGAAHAAGMRVVTITSTNPRETLEAAGADRVIDSYRELRIWPVKPKRTAEDDMAIAVLDRLRSCADEPTPVVPKVGIVKITGIENVPKAGERYALVSVRAAGYDPWRICLPRDTVRVGEDALFVTPCIVFPDEKRFRENFHVLDRVYRYGFGISERVLEPHVQRNIYRNNTGLLCPISRFPELCAGMSEAMVMNILRLKTMTGLRSSTRCKIRVQCDRSADKVSFPSI